MKLIKYLFLLVFTVGYGQAVSVDDTGNAPTEMVSTLLNNACVQFSNIKLSSEESVAFFNNNGGSFPLSNGVVIRSGIAKHSEGKYTGNNLSSQLNDNSDDYLEQINNESGQSPIITDVAFLEFDFVPLSSDFNFDFLFASNEYGEWQCVSSDVFAFILTDLRTGEEKNLAVIPDTDKPVSVRNIKDNAYNGSCEPDYPELFSSYEVDDPAVSSVNMRGFTQVLNARAQIIPGNNYRIRLVIGDSNDSNFDSAIFLAAGSFNTNVDLGEDRWFCEGDLDQLNTGLDITQYNHTWTYNGKIIPGETSNSIPVDKTGTYGVKVTRNGSSCLATDEVVFSSLEVTAPVDLLVCNEGVQNYNFNLKENDEQALGLDEELYELKYYASTEDMAAYQSIPANGLSNYSSEGDQTIFIKILNRKTRNFCDAVYSFKLLVNDKLVVNQPKDLSVCMAEKKDALVDLTVVNQEILEERLQEDFLITFYNSSQSAGNAEQAISNPTSFKVSSALSTKKIWVRMEDKFGCFTILSFNVNLNPPPPVSKLEDVKECDYYILPKITHGNYFTGTGGTGTPLFAGDKIEKPGTYYIFNGPDENGCTNESNFNVELISQYSIPQEYCGEFSVPVPPAGAFYSAPGGSAGTGVEIPTGTIFTSGFTIYFYAEIDGRLCKEEAFEIRILPLAPVDNLKDVVTCGSYTLPTLSHGNYFTQPGGKGEKLLAGKVIESTMEIYIFNKGRCSNNHLFKVTIVPEFENISACGNYELPTLEVGGYFIEASGQGKEIPAGSIISSSRRIYFFAETTTTPNCTANSFFDVEVNPIPPVDKIADVLLCEGKVFVLPTLKNGQYFTEPNREGESLSAGDIISKTSTIYINNLIDGCSNESILSVEIRPLPEVENFTDIFSCAAYELPILKYGTYYTGPGKTGKIVPGGEIITTTRTLYIYSAWEDLKSCYNERAFTVYIEGIEVGEFEDVSVCDSYTLPALNKGDYFTEKGGNGTKMKAGEKIFSSTKIFIYAQQGTRFICKDEAEFNITISKTPQLEKFENIESCGSFTLPVLPVEDFDVSYYWQEGGQSKINSYNLTTPGVHTIYVYATAKDNKSCISEKSFKVKIYPLLELKIAEDAVCVNPNTGEVETPAVLRSGLDPGEFEVHWFLNDALVYTGPNLTTKIPGDYEVRTIKLFPEKGASCNYKPTRVKVVESARPEINVTVSEPFENVAIINVEIVRGSGDYEYQLDGGEFQSSNRFNDVASGTHTVRVRGVVGYCGEAVVKVEVLKFPKYFTPNGDGFNETWNIPDLSRHSEAETYIFDRYGKLLAVIKPNSTGWDGRYNGREMPSNDYWFRVAFEQDGEAKEFKSHFSLVRK